MFIRYFGGENRLSDNDYDVVNIYLEIFGGRIGCVIKTMMVLQIFVHKYFVKNRLLERGCVIKTMMVLQRETSRVSDQPGSAQLSLINFPISQQTPSTHPPPAPDLFVNVPKFVPFFGIFWLF